MDSQNTRKKPLSQDILKKDFILYKNAPVTSNTSDNPDDKTAKMAQPERDAPLNEFTLFSTSQSSSISRSGDSQHGSHVLYKLL